MMSHDDHASAKQYLSGDFLTRETTDQKNHNKRSDILTDQVNLATNDFGVQNPRRISDSRSWVTDVKEAKSNVSETLEYQSTSSYTSSKEILSSRTISKNSSSTNSTNAHKDLLNQSTNSTHNDYGDEISKERNNTFAEFYSSSSSNSAFKIPNKLESTSMDDNLTGYAMPPENAIRSIQENTYLSSNSSFKSETTQSTSSTSSCLREMDQTNAISDRKDLVSSASLTNQRSYSASYESKEYASHMHQSKSSTNHENLGTTSAASSLNGKPHLYSYTLSDKRDGKDSYGDTSNKENLASNVKPVHGQSLFQSHDPLSREIHHIKKDYEFAYNSNKNDIVDSSSRRNFIASKTSDNISKKTENIDKPKYSTHSTGIESSSPRFNHRDETFKPSNRFFKDVNDPKYWAEANPVDRMANVNTRTRTKADTEYEYKNTYMEQSNKEYQYKNTNAYGITETANYRSNIDRSSLVDKSYEVKSSSISSSSHLYSSKTESSNAIYETTKTNSEIDRSIFETKLASSSSFDYKRKSTKDYNQQVKGESSFVDPSVLSVGKNTFSVDFDQKKQHVTTTNSTNIQHYNRYSDDIVKTNSNRSDPFVAEQKLHKSPEISQDTFANTSSAYQHYDSVYFQTSVKNHTNSCTNPVGATTYMTAIASVSESANNVKYQSTDPKSTMTFSKNHTSKKSFKLTPEEFGVQNKRAVVKLSNRTAKFRYKNPTDSDTKSNPKAVINIGPRNSQTTPKYKISVKNKHSPLSSPNVRRKQQKTYINAKPTTVIKIPSRRSITNYEPKYQSKSPSTTKKLPKTIIRIRGGNSNSPNSLKKRVRLTFGKSKPKTTNKNSAPKQKLLRVHIPVSSFTQQPKRQSVKNHGGRNNEEFLNSKRRYQINKTSKSLESTNFSRPRKPHKVTIKISNRDSPSAIVKAGVKLRNKRDCCAVDYPNRKNHLHNFDRLKQRRSNEKTNRYPRYIVKITSPADSNAQNEYPKQNCFKFHFERQPRNFRPITLLLSAGTKSSERQPSSGKHSYTVETHTGDCYWAGTNANVFIRIYGEEGNSEDIFLEESLNNKKPFVRGKVDKFKVRSKTLGKITKITLRHDNTGEFPELQLKKVVIVDDRNGQKYDFPYDNKWIEAVENEEDEHENCPEEEDAVDGKEEINEDKDSPKEYVEKKDVKEEETGKEVHNDDENETFQVVGIDPFRSQNGQYHHTNKYITKKRSLVIRRGQTFKLSVKVTGEKQRNDKLYLILKSGNSPDEADGTLVAAPQVLEESFADLQSDKKWGFTICDADDAEDVIIEVYSPSNALPAKYNLVIFKNDESIYEADFPIYLLFNPWCTDDEVYMEGEEKLREYILKQHGQVYIGNWKTPRERNWYFGQFENIALKAAFTLLEREKAADRDTAVKVSRIISSLVNSNDNNGVLVGNWSGRYDDGKPPTFWTSTPAILQKFMSDQRPVQYGQCWVFSAIVTTLMRTLGIPCRSVTNFASAHDSNGNCSNDIYLNKEGERIGEKSSDSVWNFHVWNDVWMSRPDLPVGYGGWQAIDATPQEKSKGLYQMGPASLRAVKEGAIQLGYDTGFVLAEVNADTIYWQQRENGEFEAVNRNRSYVGKNISTKEVGSNDREDITDLYKFSEGSVLERGAVNSALLKAGNKAVNKTRKDIELNLVSSKEQYYVGDDVTITIKLINNSKDDLSVSIGMASQITRYDGVEKAKLAKYNSTIHLKGNGIKNIPIKIKARTYLSHVEDDTMLRFMVSANVTSTGQVELADEVIDLAKPDLELLNLPERFKAGKEETFTVSFVNPTEKPLTKCEMYVDGSIIRNRLFIFIGNIPAQGIFKQDIRITAHPVDKDSKKSISVSFCSKELGGIQGSRKVQVVS